MIYFSFFFPFFHVYTLVGEKESTSMFFVHTNENSIQKKCERRRVEDLACDQPRSVPQEHALS